MFSESFYSSIGNFGRSQSQPNANGNGKANLRITGRRISWADQPLTPKVKSGIPSIASEKIEEQRGDTRIHIQVQANLIAREKLRYFHVRAAHLNGTTGMW